MKLDGLAGCTIIIYIFCLQLIEGRLHFNKNSEYNLLKRFLFDKSTKVSTHEPPSVTNNLIYSTSRLLAVTQKSTIASSINPCSSNPCAYGGICIPTGYTTFECQCVGPWRGIYCGIPDACYGLPCLNGGSCNNIYDEYWCQCTSEYYGNNCQHNVNHCQPNICNTGRCVSLETTYYCECPSDRYGTHCEKHFSKRRTPNNRLYYDLLTNLNKS